MDSKKIFIDTDTEISFILEDILKSENDRVCLVVPDRASIFNSIATLKLMKRVIDKSNKLLVLVTLDPLGAKLAQKVGIKTLSRIGELNEDIWQEVQKSKLDLIKNKSKVFTPLSNGNFTNTDNKKENEVFQNDTHVDSHIENVDITNPELNKVFVNIELDEIETSNKEIISPDISFNLDNLNENTLNEPELENFSAINSKEILFFKGIDVLENGLKNEKNYNKA